MSSVTFRPHALHRPDPVSGEAVISRADAGAPAPGQAPASGESFGRVRNRGSERMVDGGNSSGTRATPLNLFGLVNGAINGAGAADWQKATDLFNAMVNAKTDAELHSNARKFEAQLEQTMRDAGWGSSAPRLARAVAGPLISTAEMRRQVITNLPA